MKKYILAALLSLPAICHGAFTTDWLRNTSSSITVNGSTYTWNVGDGGPGKFIMNDNRVLTSSTPAGTGGGGGSATPGGTPTQIQYNVDGVSLGGVANSTWTLSTNTLTLGTTISLDKATSMSFTNFGTMTFVNGSVLIATDSTHNTEIRAGRILWNDGTIQVSSPPAAGAGGGGGGYAVQPATVTFLLDRGVRTSTINITDIGAGVLFTAAATGNVYSGQVSPSTNIANGLLASGVQVSSVGAQVLVASFPATGVTAGSYTNTNLTVDAQGRLSAASNGSGGSASASGSNGAIQFASNTVLGSDPPFFYSTATKTLYISSVVIGGTTFFYDAANQRFSISTHTAVNGDIYAIGTATGMSTFGGGLIVGNDGLGDIVSSFTVKGANSIEMLKVYSPTGVTIATTTTHTKPTIFQDSVTISAPVLASGAGTSGQVFTSNGVGTAPTWQTSSSGGTSIYNATSTAGFPFGLSASTGVFTSSVTISGNIKIADGSSTVPNIARSLDTTTGISISNLNVSALIGGGSKLTVASGVTTISQPTIVTSTLDSGSDETVSIQNFTVDETTNYVRLNFYHQPNSLFSRELSIGMRTDRGEDAYFFISPVDVNTGIPFSTDVVHVNVSTSSINRGNFGILVSTPLARLSVGGHIQIATNTTTNPVVSACGTTPSVLGHDAAGTITVGTGGVATSCTLTFGTAWTNAPTCSAWHEGAILYVRPVTTTTTLVVDAATPLTASGKIKYSCVGFE